MSDHGCESFIDKISANPQLTVDTKNMKRILLLAWIVLCTVRSAFAMATAVSSNGNTNPPSDNRGWSTQCHINGSLYTVISSNAVIGTSHTAIYVFPGYEVEFNGQNYSVASVTHYPSNDVAIIKINESFPPDSWAEIMTNPIVAGMGITMFGYGAVNGKPVYRQLALSNFVRGQTVEFDVRGCVNGTQFVVEQTANLVNWVTLPTMYTSTSQIFHVVLPTTDDPSMFYRIMSPNMVTNSLLIGWETGYSDGNRRWATNVISWLEQRAFVSHFDRDAGNDESCLTAGDSSGGCFVKDTDGKWKLAGINKSSQDLGPWSMDGGQTGFWGTMLDTAGLDKVEYNPETGQYDYSYTMPTDQVFPGRSRYVFIDINWVLSVLSQP